MHSSANLFFHFSNKNGKRTYYLSLSVRAHFGQSNFSFFQQKRKQEILFMVRAHFGQSNFPFFQQKRKKEILLILIIFAYFIVQKKKRKIENGQDNRSFFSFF